MMCMYTYSWTKMSIGYDDKYIVFVTKSFTKFIIVLYLILTKYKV